MAHPNVIVCLADDLGYGDLALYGNPDVKTPHLSRLAKNGVHLTQHYSASPLCAPARAGLLTGRYNHRTGALSVESNRGLDRIALNEKTMADVYKEAGYATGMIGKWHNGLHDLRYHPSSRGFDEFCGFLNGGMDYWDWLIERNGKVEHQDGRYLTDVFSEEAVHFIERHRTEPFFLYLAYNAPHSPLQAPKENVEPYLKLGKYNRAVSTLYAMIERMDAGIGQILDKLDDLGLVDNTIVLFTSDNGPWLGHDRVAGESMSMARFNGPFRGMKQDVLEGGIRVPAIIRWPAGLPAHQDISHMVHFTDWLPTLAAACNLKTSAKQLDGLNQLPTLRAERGQLPKQRFWQFNRYQPVKNCNAAMRDGDWKLYWPRVPAAMTKMPEDTADYHLNFKRPHILKDVDPPFERILTSSKEPELYNLAKDPYEAVNLAKENPEQLSRMKTQLENWFDGVTAERLNVPKNQA